MHALNLSSQDQTENPASSLIPIAVVSGLFFAACVVVPIWVSDQRQQQAVSKRMEVCLANSPACDLSLADVNFTRRHLRNVQLYERLEASNVRARHNERTVRADEAAREWEKESVELDKQLGLTTEGSTP